MITKMKKIFMLSAGLLVASGLISDCFAETNTAANVLGNILTAAAGAIGNNRQAGNQGQTAQTTPAEQTNENSSETTGQTALPNAEENTVAPGDQPKAEESTGTEGQTAAPQPENLQKRSGFVDKDGDILVAPSTLVFPNEMEDGKIYFFSRDVDNLKQKIAAGEKLPFPEQQNPAVQQGAQQNVQTQAPKVVQDDVWKLIPKDAQEQSTVTTLPGTQPEGQTSIPTEQSGTTALPTGITQEIAQPHPGKRPMMFQCYVVEAPDMPTPNQTTLPENKS